MSNGGGSQPPPVLRLYRLPVSNCCSGVLAALIHKGIRFEDCTPPGGHFNAEVGQWRPGYGTDEYKQIVPMGTIPAVVIETEPMVAPGYYPAGAAPFVLSESSTIVEFLEDAYPLPALLPSSPTQRAKLRFAVRLHDLHINPRVKELFGHIDPRTRDVTQVAATLDALRAALLQLDRASWVAGWDGRGKTHMFFDFEAFSLVDCCVPLTIILADRLAHALGQPSPVSERAVPGQSDAGQPWRGRVKSWVQEVVKHPTLVGVVAEAKVATDEWLRRKLSGDDTAFEDGWWDAGKRDHQPRPGAITRSRLQPADDRSGDRSTAAAAVVDCRAARGGCKRKLLDVHRVDEVPR